MRLPSALLLCLSVSAVLACAAPGAAVYPTAGDFGFLQVDLMG